MKKRITLSMIILSSIVAILIIAFLLPAFYSQYENQTRRSIKAETLLISKSISYASDKYNYLNSVKSAISDLRITLIAQNGDPIYDTHSDIATMENHLNRPEISEAIKNGSAQNTRFSTTLGTKTYYYAILLEDQSILRLSYTTENIYAVIIRFVLIAIVIALGILVLSYIISARLSKKIIAPLNNINLDTPNLDSPYDEFSPFIKRISMQNKQISSQVVELKKQRIQTDTITANMSEGLVVLNNQAQILSINKSALLLFPDTSFDVVGKNILYLTRDITLNSAIKTALLENNNNGILSILEKEYHYFANPVYADGKVAGAILLFLDITDKQRAEKMRREFTANVSHELKTPLTSISGYAELISNNMAKPEDIKLFAEKIQTEASRLITLINDIIRLSELDENSRSKEFLSVNLLEVVKNTAATLLSQVEKNNIKLIITGEAISINGNKSMLEELVFNLLDNAIKYNKQNGTVSINLSLEDTHPVLKVTDSGIGIPHEHQNRIFERFYTVDKSRSKKTGGTGLGLSIVKHIAQYHNATILLESTPDEGTSITIKFNQ